MITKEDIEERAREWGLAAEVVEKDYVIGWLLWGIGSSAELSSTWAFKGGTCLKKCFYETFRFSEDLDFSVLPGGPIAPDHAGPPLRDMLERVQAESGINFGRRELYMKAKDNGRALEGRVYYQGPRGDARHLKVKLDLTSSEVVVRPTVLRDIVHSFPDALPHPGTVRCYAFEEVFGEKLRAMGERGRPRDLYDIVNLYRHRGLGAHPDIIRKALIEKCESKGVEVPTWESIRTATTREELVSEWEHMLGHQLPALPPFELYWAELENLFLWLDGELQLEDLPPVAFKDTEDRDWSPPPYISTWRVGVPIETVRFAAANLLTIELGYNNSTRIVEPYSLRRSKAGALLLYGQRPDRNHIQAYRVDKVESVKVLTGVFEPLYPVDFSPTGAITARPISSKTRSGRSTHPSRSTRRTTASGPTYVVECGLCKKRFPRKTQSTKLRPHKDPKGWNCPGRTGWVADTKWS